MVEVQVLVIVQQVKAHPLDDERAGAADPHQLRALAGVATLGDPLLRPQLDGLDEREPRLGGLTPFRRSGGAESCPVARGFGQGDWSDHVEQQEAS